MTNCSECGSYPKTYHVIDGHRTFASKWRCHQNRPPWDLPLTTLAARLTLAAQSQHPGFWVEMAKKAENDMSTSFL